MGAQLVVPFVNGMQSQGVIATVKHYINNNQEVGRMTSSAEVDQRVEREMYLPPFEAAVKGDGEHPGAMSVMCGYNLVNGKYNCENNETMAILRQEYGFQGFFMSDWLATHSTGDALRAGLDQEMPGGDHFTGEHVKYERDDQKNLDQKNVDEAATHIVTAMEAVGVVGKGLDATGNIADDVTSDDNRRLAREIVSQSTILLKNEACGVNVKMLPLSAKRARRVVVVGSPEAAGHGSGFVSPKQTVGVAEGIERKLKVGRFGPGGDLANVPEPEVPAVGLMELLQDEAAANADTSSPAASLGGERLRVFLNEATSAARRRAKEARRSELSALGRIEDVDGGESRMMGDGVWEPELGPENPTYWDGGESLMMGQELPEEKEKGPRAGLGREDKDKKEEERLGGEAGKGKGKEGSLGVDESGSVGSKRKELESWVRFFGSNDVNSAVEAAEQADVAVVVVGTNAAESVDRESLSLGEEDEAAIRAVAAANKCTAVVMLTPGAILTPWRDDVAAILAPFLPGESHGDAIADVLFGDVDPGGRLPLTMPKVGRCKFGLFDPWIERLTVSNS